MKNKLIPTSRVKLKPNQLKRVKELSGEGESSKYNAAGEMELQRVRGLAKARAKASRYVLYTNQLGKRLYITKEVNEDAPLSFTLSEALHFYEGFDDPITKILGYERVLRKYSPFPFNLQTEKIYG